MKTLIQLLGEQVLPNAIAADLIRPDRVLCLDTGRFAAQTTRLEQVLGIPHESVSADAYDLDANVRTVLGVLDRCAGDEVWLNFTGGTKMMALAAVVPGLQRGCRCVYVDTVRRRLVEANRNLQSTSLDTPAPSFGLTDIIALAGERLIPDPAQDDPLRHWDACLALQGSFASWRLTQEAARVRQSDPPPAAGQIQSEQSTAAWDGDRIELALYRRQGDRTDRFSLRHPQPLAWLAGGWREEFAACSLIRGGACREVRMNVRLEWSAATLQVSRPGFDPAKNEIDVFAVFGWRPVVIECKSAWYDAAVLHKLKFLRDHLCGAFGVAILATGSRPRADIVEKARDQGLHLLAGPAWKRFGENVIRCCQSAVPLTLQE